MLALPVRRGAARLPLPTDALLMLLSVYWALSANRAFLAAAWAAMAGPSLNWLLLLPLLALLNFVMLWPLTPRPLAKPVLVGVALLAAVCGHYAQSLGAVFDPAMLRNALHTDWSEARELLGPRALLQIAIQLLPAWALIAAVELRPPRPGWRARLQALGRWLLALALLAGGLLLVYQPLASLMRSHRELRYQLVPAAPLWSLPRSLLSQAHAAVKPREAIGLDAAPGPSWTQAQRPRLLVLVVGETVRAANWGRRTLADGSLRDTTPLLAAQGDLHLLPTVRSCGSDTETSLPCMFAPVGRRDYDEARIRGQQSLLQVLARAGVSVEWLDNQSGCKGVCDGLPTEQLRCDGGHCLDDELFAAVAPRLQALKRHGGTQLLVLHMLGNHGPAYHRRVPEGFAPYEPACAQDDLGRCSRESIVNAYDNALRHTDRLLAALWQQLRAAQAEVDTAMIFLPDHGESLGEQGLYLHGLPYAIAPREQTEVPMLIGLSPAWAQARGWSADCLARIAGHPAPQHEHLFHTLLDLLDVRTSLYTADWDLLRSCR